MASYSPNYLQLFSLVALDKIVLVLNSICCGRWPRRIAHQSVRFKDKHAFLSFFHWFKAIFPYVTMSDSHKVSFMWVAIWNGFSIIFKASMLFPPRCQFGTWLDTLHLILPFERPSRSILSVCSVRLTVELVRLSTLFRFEFGCCQ